MEAVLPLAEDDWVEVLRSLAAKEGESSLELELASDDGGGCYLRSARKDAVEWVSRAAARHAFSPLTAVLAVNYLDRCFLSRAAGGGLRLQDDKPWMGRLAAVACLSLAAKVEETRVPLLLDLQAEEGKYVFEPRTIRRMELLVLAALRWRMNPVTPLSFIHHLLPRLRSKDKIANTDPSAATGIAMARRCEAALLSAIADWRWVQFPSSVWAAAALLQASAVAAQESHCVISLLNVPMAKVEECHQLMLESASAAITGHKRKHSSSVFHYCSSPPSPIGVVGSCFGSESSSDSQAMRPPSPAAHPLQKQINGSERGRC
ncbi:cyclin-D3-2-like [Musa acuminata AAA Group]|uniref:cyclin-D3-2-like n=1 Tax=Musa acuminata AAA Group TaxID=214697 RepID=UPI0031DB079B